MSTIYENMTIDELFQLVVELIERNQIDEIKEIFDKLHTYDQYQLFDKMESNQRQYIYINFEPKVFAAIFSEMEIQEQIELFEEMDPILVAKILDEMDTDDAASLISELPQGEAIAYLSNMEEESAEDIKDLLIHDEDSAGAKMTQAFLYANINDNVKTAMKKVVTYSPEAETIYVIYVLDDDEKLVGVLSLKDLILARANENISDIMTTRIISVYVDEDKEAAAKLFRDYDLMVLPVIDNNNYLLGIITVDDIIDIIIDEHAEDMLLLSGVNKDESVKSSALTSVKNRLPWLCVNLVTAFTASTVISFFENEISAVVALAAAMPIVAGLGGNAGSQTLSVVIRSIALGELNLIDDYKIVYKEALVGLIDGFVIGLISGIALYIRYDNVFLGLIILIAMTCNLIIAGIFGFLIPLILKKLKFDPALSSSIFVTASTDILGFLFFLSLARIFMPLLV